MYNKNLINNGIQFNIHITININIFTIWKSRVQTNLVTFQLQSINYG